MPQITIEPAPDDEQDGNVSTKQSDATRNQSLNEVTITSDNLALYNVSVITKYTYSLSNCNSMDNILVYM